jgi:hypothetical protein
MKKRNVIRLNETKLRKIITESIKTILKEHYRGKLYHFTTLAGLFGMAKTNKLDSSYGAGFREDGYEETRKVNNDTFICFTRNSRYDITKTYDAVLITCRLTFDADKLMSIRGAKLYPVNWKGEESMGEYSESEERLYVDSITPLSSFVESIDIVFNEYALNNDYSLAYFDCDDEDVCDMEDVSEMNKEVIRRILKSPLGPKIKISNTK